VPEAYTQVSVVLKSTESSPHEDFSILQRPIIKYHTRILHIPILQVCMASMFILLFVTNQLKMRVLEEELEIDQLVQKMEDTLTGRKSRLETRSNKVRCRSHNLSGEG
jgi:hypothetical protein